MGEDRLGTVRGRGEWMSASGGASRRGLVALGMDYGSRSVFRRTE